MNLILTKNNEPIVIMKIEQKIVFNVDKVLKFKVTILQRYGMDDLRFSLENKRNLFCSEWFASQLGVKDLSSDWTDSSLTSFETDFVDNVRKPLDISNVGLIAVAPQWVFCFGQ